MMKSHPLSHLDRQPHIRNYGRYITVFPFPYPHRADAAYRALRTGLAATLAKFPFLAGVLDVDADGSLRLLYASASPARTRSAEKILSVKFAYTGLSYDELEARDFDPELFPLDTFTPALVHRHPGLDPHDPCATGPTSFAENVQLPVLAAQATFFCGGVALGVWVHHGVADGAGLTRLYAVWSGNTRGGGEEEEEEEEGGDENGADVAYALDALAKSPVPESVYSPLPPTPTSAPPPRPGYATKTRLLRVGAARLLEMSASLSTPGNRISPFTALASLLWSHILLSHPPPHPSPSTLAIVVDLRPRLGAPFTHPDYVGNCVLSARSTTSTPNPSVAELANLISASLRGFTKARITARLATLVANAGLVDNAGLEFDNGGRDVYITDVRRQGAGLDWGILGQASAIRRIGWRGEGGIVVLPRTEGGKGDWEVMICLEEGVMSGVERGLREGGWLVDSAEKKVGKIREKL